MTDATTAITVREFRESEGVEDWRVISEGACAFFATESFAASTAFATAIGKAIGEGDATPAIDIRAGGVTVRFISSSAEHFGLTSDHVDLARRVSAVARTMDLAADPSKLQSLLIVPGAPNVAEVLPFWRAVLGYDPRPDSPAEDLVDPLDRSAAFWFEQMEEPRSDGNGSIHLAVWVPYEEAEARVAAALAAGGRMIRDEFAPAWWTLADPAGNEADIATTMSRD